MAVKKPKSIKNRRKKGTGKADDREMQSVVLPNRLPGLIVTLGLEIDLDGAPGLGAQRAAVAGDLEER